MAYGRLSSKLIPPYQSAEIYNNSSGSQSSITINGQVISSTANSIVSVAVTATDYSSTTTVGTSVTTTSVNTFCCLKNVVYCRNATEDYQGYYVQESGNTCFSPSYVSTTGTVYKKSYTPCLCANVMCNGGVVSTAVNPEVIVSLNPSAPTIAEADAANVLRVYYPSAITNISTRAQHFADVCANGTCCLATYCYSFGTYMNAYAVDMYSSCSTWIGYSCSGSGDACSCVVTSAGSGAVTCTSCAGSGWIRYPVCCTFCSHPTLFAGCELFGYTGPFSLGYYRFKAINVPTYGIYLTAATLSENIGPSSCCCWGGYSLTTCAINTGAGGIAWVAYNPSDGLNYMMHYSDGKCDDGIYRVSASSLSNLKCISYTCGGCCCCLSENLSSSSIFTKVAPLPSVFSSLCSFCPKTRLYHAETCKWIWGVYCSGSWVQFVTCDLVNWSRLDCGSSCFISLTPCLNVYASTGNGINKYTNNYFTCINCSGTLDYCVCANQYTRTGIVISNGDRIYMNNFGSSPIAVNVWGYEG